jgi:hypothetical protein
VKVDDELEGEDEDDIKGREEEFEDKGEEITTVILEES